GTTGRSLGAIFNRARTAAAQPSMTRTLLASICWHKQYTDLFHASTPAARPRNPQQGGMQGSTILAGAGPVSQDRGGERFRGALECKQRGDDAGISLNRL